MPGLYRQDIASAVSFLFLALLALLAFLLLFVRFPLDTPRINDYIIAYKSRGWNYWQLPFGRTGTQPVRKDIASAVSFLFLALLVVFPLTRNAKSISLNNVRLGLARQLPLGGRIPGLERHRFGGAFLV